MTSCPGDELIVTPESGVKLYTLIVHHAVGLVREALQRDRWALDVLEKSFQSLSVSRGNPALGVEVEAGVLPASE